jgi:hypothetical protein
VWIYREFYHPLVFFQGGSGVMDIEVENVTDFKKEEEEEDPLSVTCPELNIEKEVSCVCVCVIEKCAHAPLSHRFPRQWVCLTECMCVFTLDGCLIVTAV